MDAKLRELHRKAGIACGKFNTCGTKKGYSTEEIALKFATSHNKWEKRKHDVEPYPCAFCGLWHIGRIMSEEELLALAKHA